MTLVTDDTFSIFEFLLNLNVQVHKFTSGTLSEGQEVKILNRESKYHHSTIAILFMAMMMGFMSSCAMRLNGQAELQALLDAARDDEEEPVVPPEDCELDLKVLLWDGYFNTATQKLKTTINAAGKLPLVTPYSGAPYYQGTTETVGAGFFATYPELADWVLIELRSTTAASSVVARQSGFLDENGKLRDITGAATMTFNVPPDDYYVVVYHHSHLAVISSSAIAFSASATATYDFTDAANKSLQGQTGDDLLVQVSSGEYTMRAGDLDYDNIIFYPKDSAQLLANIQIDIGYTGSVAGQSNNYMPGDFTANGQVRYTGASNDRDRILIAVGGFDPTVRFTGSSFISYPLNPVDGGSYLDDLAGSSAISLKVLFKGPFDTMTGTMSRAMSTLALLPTASPYGADADLDGATTTPSVSGAFLTGSPEIVDWIQLEFRMIRTGPALAKVSAFVLENGNVMSTSGSLDVSVPLVAGNYYVVIRHRSHLLTMSAARIATSATPTQFDLSNMSTKTYSYSLGSTVNTGGAVLMVAGAYGILGGDFNQDGIINCGAAGNDDDYLLNTILGGDSNAVVSTYNSADYNLDGSTFYTGASNDFDAMKVGSLSNNCINTRTALIPL